jgi:hypothetical protein
MILSYHCFAKINIIFFKNNRKRAKKSLFADFETLFADFETLFADFETHMPSTP